MAGDVVTLENDTLDGEPLLYPVMRAGRRVAPAPTLAEIRQRAARELAALPPSLRRLDAEGAYPVEIGQGLQRMTEEVDRRLAAHG